MLYIGWLLIIVGLFFILSALLISGAFLAVGLFDATRLGLASVAFPSALIGMWVGNWLGTRVPAHRFKTLILTVLGCLGANLLWRGISG